MTNKRKISHALCVSLAVAVATATAAETDHAWRFDTSGRVAAITTPVEAAGTNVGSLERPSWVERTCSGIVTSGLCIIIR